MVIRAKLKLSGLLPRTIMPVCLACAAAHGQNNDWTNSSGAGRWDDPMWSLGVLPGSNQTVRITNNISEIVKADASTSVNYPNSLNIGSLVMWAPDGVTNTLVLDSLTANAPFRINRDLDLGTNSVITNHKGGMIFGGGSPYSSRIDGDLMQDGGLVAATNTDTYVNGSISLIEATANFGTLRFNYSGLIDQTGGSAVIGNVLPKSSVPGGAGLAMVSYNLRGGMLQVSNFTAEAGQFTQYGGTNQANTFAAADYTLLDGLLSVGTLKLASINDNFGVAFNHIDGSVIAQNVQLGAGGYHYPSYGVYTLDNGSLRSSQTIVGANNGEGFFRQMGGAHVTSNLTIAGTIGFQWATFNSWYSLSYGVLSCSNLSIQMLGSFYQSGGTNLIAGTLNVAGAFYNDNLNFSFSGGTLAASNTIIRGSAFVQSGGLHLVTNLLALQYFSGLAGTEYDLSGGSLIASNIEVAGIFNVAAGPKTIYNPGYFSLNGTLSTGNGDQNLGRFILAGNSSIRMGSGIFAFDESSGETWPNGATLTIVNWNGCGTGGGPTQLRFGRDQNGLTPDQLARIIFVNPTGSPAGNYPAMMLNTGEIVPVPPPVLGVSSDGANLIVAWKGMYVLQSSTNIDGPYVDVAEARSPYTNSLSLYPQQFFRLRN